MIMDRLLDLVRILRPLRHRDFRLLWTGMTASLIGDGIFLVSLAWQVYELSNTPTALSIVGIAITVPQIIFLLLGGVVSDRFDRRRVMIAADARRSEPAPRSSVPPSMRSCRSWCPART